MSLRLQYCPIYVRYDDIDKMGVLFFGISYSTVQYSIIQHMYSRSVTCGIKQNDLMMLKIGDIRIWRTLVGHDRGEEKSAQLQIYSPTVGQQLLSFLCVTRMQFYNKKISSK